MVQPMGIIVGKEAIPEFSQEMLKRWEKGRSQYGDKITIDPFDEAMQECIDGANYLMMIYNRIKKLKAKTQALNQEATDAQSKTST